MLVFNVLCLVLGVDCCVAMCLHLIHSANESREERGERREERREKKRSSSDRLGDRIASKSEEPATLRLVHHRHSPNRGLTTSRGFV